ncbi:MAG: pyridoxamine 5'-phosphate oxidase family protein [Acidimicrobiales bacterium]
MDKHDLVELSEEQCWWHLAEMTVGRLAVSVANRPDIFPVNYRIDGETIVVKTAPGFKLAAATLGDGVAFEVDKLDESARTGWSVVVHGTAAEVELLEDLLAADDLHVEPWASGSKNHYIRITPSDLTGRAINP